MKNKKKIKITLLISIILTCFAIPIILYFTIHTSNNLQKINLATINIQHLAKVEYMNKINEKEASTMKNNIQSKIDDKMSKLNLEENIDYEIKGLKNIKKDIHLNTIQIKITSLKISKKATGNFNIYLNVQENINNRISELIKIPKAEENNLSYWRAGFIKSIIIQTTNQILNIGQKNYLNIDYQILNLSLIIPGAKFEEYNNKIIVKATPKTNKLEGSFLINFQLQ